MMFSNSIKEILLDIWPSLIICFIIITSLRITFLVKNKIKFIFYKEILMLGFIMYVIALFEVVTFQDVSWSSSNFIPFKEMLRYEFGTKLFFKNVVGNMIMFIPFGFFTSYFLKLKKPYSILLLSLLISSTIETTQLLIGRVFDVDDIILNVVGGVVGFAVYKLFSILKEHLPAFLKKDMIYNIIMLILLLFLFWQLYQIINIGGAI